MRYFLPEGSTRINKLGYDANQQVLHVVFNPNVNDLYEYLDVPPPLVLALLSAESLGAFLAQRVRGKFDYRKYDIKDTIPPNQREPEKLREKCSYVSKDGRPCALFKHDGFHAVKPKGAT